jgi:hypothetical protein
MMQLMLAQPKIDVDSPVVTSAGFDPPVVEPGQEATYRVTVNALETAIDWPDKIPSPAGLACNMGARGQILSMAGMLLVPRTTFNYRVQAAAAGAFTIPEFSVVVNGKPVKVPAARLDVTATPPPGIPPAQRLLLEVPTNGLFAGQTVRARVLWPGSPAGTVQSLGQVQLNGQGFVVDQSSAHVRIEAIPFGNSRRTINAFVYELMLTPIATGKISLFAQGYAAGTRVIGGIIMPGPGGVAGPQSQFTLVDSDPVTLEIRPLPRGSELPGFTGAVGIYSVDPPELSTNVVAVGEPVKLKVRVRGDGNLARLVPPQPPQLRDWQIFAAPTENTPSQIIQAQGFATFSYTLIPLTDKQRSTPPIPFSGFNPDHGAYDDLTIESVPITITPGTVTPADLLEVARAEQLDADAEKEPVLSGLANAPGLIGGLVPVQQRGWFPLLHLVPASALFALWAWDRRRRFMERYPEIILRRRALRALRRERRRLARAARARDGATFATVAVNAMQVAVAPYFPAEPRALVGADVLAMLPHQEQSDPAAKTVREFFSRTDAARFGAAADDTAELLQLKPEIEGVLDRLEAKLCG